MKRANFIGAPEFYELNQACRTITEAFGWNLYLVGSCLAKRDHRDVDLRLILADEEFDKMFPGIGSNWSLDARWSLMCSAISLWLAKHSGLRIDFQIQRQTQANEENPRGQDHEGERQCMGMFLEPKREPTQ